MVLLLGLLGFLAIRADLVKRKVPFIAAMVCWGGARMLTEFSFKLTPETGELAYKWGSIASCTSELCLILCLLLIYCACAPLTAGRDQTANPAAGSEVVDADDESASTASERIKHIIEHDEP